MFFENLAGTAAAVSKAAAVPKDPPRDGSAHGEPGNGASGGSRLRVFPSYPFANSLVSSAGKS